MTSVKMLSKTFYIIEDFTARTPILGWCLGILLMTIGATDEAKAAIAKCNNSTISYIVGAIFISLSQGYDGLLFALMFASIAGATGGVFGHYTEATTADKVLTPKKETRDKLASYLIKDVRVSVMIGVTAGIIIEVLNAVLGKSFSDAEANFAAVELCAALSVYYSLPEDAGAEIAKATASRSAVSNTDDSAVSPTENGAASDASDGVDGDAKEDTNANVEDKKSL